MRERCVIMLWWYVVVVGCCGMLWYVVVGVLQSISQRCIEFGDGEDIGTLFCTCGSVR